MRTTPAIAGLAAALLLVGCPPSGAPTQPPPPPPPGSGYQPGAAVGAACDVNNDCASGVCEGQGCGVGQGVCAAADRMCTMDAASYCGCDGQTFTASGSCAGRRYASRGECAPAGKPDGDACVAASDCASGVCEGQGCGDDAPGVCASTQRACTMDAARYCGCDGQTFTASGSCPGQRFAQRGPCAPPPAADGAACLANSDCASGVCEGQGCGPDAPGACAPANRACTKDLRTYCGCDGQTFRASGSCPGKRFSARAACP
ncbi:MAG: hypothetical protein IPH44_17225 [Myxococcales bacterium]|nr:hypothetical protein [Myxococcales bacterium]MBK7196497.1 hypothetical protein [Myxococcales bacterium]MBP6848995.1 hypothetical protein [Kofleriaceae bacterium]